ncbi:helix-turn-helix domain-containing protein [Effusibacillus consociatus]|uniref:Helix-turn-helix domain-containing protein n=1 Tax=Effusibacillus consociatus TaxID=1117041 RepID=A0ABV9Q2V7_9BACL
MTKTLGQKIRELRVQKGLTQGDLGGGKVTPSMISQIEADKANPSHRLLKWISDKLETPIEYFLTDMQLQSEKISSFRFAKALIEAGEPRQAIPILEQLADGQSLPMYQQEIQRDLAACYRNIGRLDEAAKMLEEVFSAALMRRETAVMVQALKEMGWIERERHNYPLAIYHWNRANHLHEEMENANPFEWARLLQDLADLHNYLGEYTPARSAYEKAMALLSGTSDLKGIADVYLNLSRLYRAAGEYDSASEFAQHAFSINKSIQNIKLSVQIQETYAVLKAETGQPQEAIALLEECLEQYEKYGLRERIAPVHGAISNIYLKQRQLEQAKFHCQLALEKCLDDTERAALYRTWAKTAKEQGQIQEAMEAARRAIDFFSQAKLPRDLAYSYSLLGDLYKETGDLTGAVQAFENMRMAMEANLKERGIVL